MVAEITKDLLDAYRKEISSYDEVLDAGGAIKPHWKKLFSSLGAMGIEELKNRNQEIKNKIRENGVTYNVYESPDGMNRPWKLDPIPFLIEQKEWQGISKGLQQRAVLLDLILRDIYGERKLIKDQVLPAELVFGNTGFLRSCQDVKLPTQNQLVKYAADMARGPDGRMWILDNRTQSPSGSGYALENRVIVSKVMSDMAKDMYISRLSPFFTHAQQSIFRVFKEKTENLNVVYLTPGPANETYFEHAYLASYLGYTLVLGDDLVVKDGQVFIKSIDGLRRVDVIVRRVDDEWCDPLELREDSRLGVPGLLQAMREGHVMVINPPGSSVLENNAFNAFLPSACRYFLNEDLLLPSVATWWCGQEKELAFVLENLPRLIIKKTNRKQVFRSVYGRELSAEKLAELKKQILKNPADYVAQEEVSFSTTPAFVDDRIEPRFAAIRAFLTATPNGYQVMQGGLTRSSPLKDRFTFSNQYGGIAKDTWIVSDEAEIIKDRIVLPALASHVNAQSSLPSRSAENMFWAGRYSERSMAAATFLTITLNALNFQRNFGNTNKIQHIDILLKSLSHLMQVEPGFLGEEGEERLKDPYPVVLDMISNRDKPGTIVSSTEAFLRAMISVREKWNLVTWRVIDLIENINNKFKNPGADLQKSLDKLQTRLFTFYGIVVESVPRTNGYYLFEAGKLIERILSKIVILRSVFAHKTDRFIENELLEAVLMNHFALVHYRSAYRSNFETEYVLDTVLLNKQIPSSLVSLLDALDFCLAQLPATDSRLSAAQKAVLAASTRIRLVDIREVSRPEHRTMHYARLDEVLSDVYASILTVSDHTTNLYFNHTSTQHSLNESIPGPDDEI